MSLIMTLQPSLDMPDIRSYITNLEDRDGEDRKTVGTKRRTESARDSSEAARA